MAESTKSLKTQNIPLIGAIAGLDALCIAAITHPDLDFAHLSTISAVRWLSSAAVPVLVMLLTSILPATTKAILVFWRLKDTLPGHRAFSRYARSDPRIDLARLKKSVGEFPVEAREQNSRWYQLFKKVEGDLAVAGASKNWLLSRDLAAMSFLLCFAAPPLLLLAGAGRAEVELCAALFAVQYLVAALVARNQGVSLVTNVLAVHSTKGKI